MPKFIGLLTYINDTEVFRSVVLLSKGKLYVCKTAKNAFMAAIQQNYPIPRKQIMNFGTDGPVLVYACINPNILFII